VIVTNSQRSNKKLILILSTTLSIILVFGGFIGAIILWKYRANGQYWVFSSSALALREIQQGIFLFIYYFFVSIVYIIISHHHALNIIITR
jgi:uncharacterized Tic20 family protein